MKMFTRDMILNGPPVAVREWAVGIARAYEEVTGNDLAVWTSLAGGINGHTTWSMPVEGAATLTAAAEQAFADEGYLARIEEGRGFFRGEPHDTLYRAYTPVPDGRGEPGNVAVVTSATAAAGNLGAAVGWGMEAAEHVAKVAGVETVLLGNSAGSFSRLTWITVVEDAAAADAMDDATSDDEGYRKLVARGGPYFVDDSARTQLFLRIG